MLATGNRKNHAAELVLEWAATWRYLHDLFRSPSPVQWTWLHSDGVQTAWTILAHRTEREEWSVLPLPSTYETYAEGYISTFEVGMPEPPCPLIESHWNKRDPVPKVLHENMLFYKQFGLELRSSSNETADHLRHQLEFMCHLCRMESMATTGGQAEYIDQCARARVDYLNRHLAFWVPRAHAALEQIMPESWNTKWMYVLSRCCVDFSSQ